MSRISGDKAKEILSEVPQEKAFHFYEDVGVYTGRWASSLRQFCDIVGSVNGRSLEFHLERRDFEKWVRSLKDEGLALQIAKLRGRKLTGEALRSALYALVKKRVDGLQAKMQG